METEQDSAEVLETQPTEETTETVEDTPEGESVEELKARLETERKSREETEAKNKQLFERAKKAEEAAKTKTEASQDALSNKDVIYLAKADIHPDDIDDVLKQARVQGIPVQAAHKFMMPILNERTEERKTATVTTIRSARGATKASGEDLLAKAEKTGEVPEDEAGMQELFRARLARKFPKRN